MKRNPSPPTDPAEARAKSTHPVDTLTVEERDRCRAIAFAIGETAAIARLGRLNRTTFYKCVAGFPVARLTAQALRAALDTLPADDATTTAIEALPDDHD